MEELFAALPKTQVRPPCLVSTGSSATFQFPSLPFYKVLHTVLRPNFLVGDEKLCVGGLAPCMPWCGFVCTQEGHQLFTACSQVECTARQQRTISKLEHNKEQEAPLFQLRFSSFNHPFLSGQDCTPPGLRAVLGLANSQEDKTSRLKLEQPAGEAEEYPRKPSAPLNFTWQMVLGDSDLTESVDQTLQLDLRWAADLNVRYWYTLQIVQPLSVDTVMQSVVNKTWRPSEDTRNLLVTDDSIEDDEVGVVKERLSLLCPLSTARMENAVRSDSCAHPACFDLLSFLKLNHQTPSWTCPLCRQPVTLEDLRVDTYVMDILDALLDVEDCPYVEINKEDGSWKFTITADFSADPTLAADSDSESNDSYKENLTTMNSADPTLAESYSGSDSDTLFGIGY